MSAYGKVRPFNPKVDDWEIYEEKLRFYLAANDTTDAKKQRSILLTVCGDPTFKLLRSLVPKGKLDADDITYDSLVALLKSHFKKKQSTVVNRFSFNTRAKQPSESIVEYIAALRESVLQFRRQRQVGRNAARQVDLRGQPTRHSTKTTL